MWIRSSSSSTARAARRSSLQRSSPSSGALSFPQSRRGISTAFSATDASPSRPQSASSSSQAQQDVDFLHPNLPLHAKTRGWKYLDDAAVRGRVLERNNTGMGFLLLNHQSLHLPSVNVLVKKLRNLEVNSTKRFVIITNQLDDDARERDRRRGMFAGTLSEEAVEDVGFVVDGWDRTEQLIFEHAERAVVSGRGPADHDRVSGLARVIMEAYLLHFQELTLLLADYRKPLLHLNHGSLYRDEALAWLRFCNWGAVYKGSVGQITSLCGDGFVAPGELSAADEHEEIHCTGARVLFGGLSLVLARSPIALFMALSGLPVDSQDLVYAGLASHWVSPDALPFLEISAEKISFQLSERDGRRLIQDEHFLPVPDPSPWFKERGGEICAILSDAASFGGASLATVCQGVRRAGGDRAFANQIADQIELLDRQHGALFRLNWALIQAVGAGLFD